MIANGFGTAAAIVLIALASVACANRSDTRASGGASASGTTGSTAGSSAASGPEAMGRGRCEALSGAERDKCFAEERGQRSDARK